MNRLLLTRFQLGRITWWVQTQSFSKLPDYVVPLKCPSSANSGFCKIYLIGTLHISKKSCAKVQAIIDIVRPEIVFLELCKSRQHLLTAKQQAIRSCGTVGKGQSFPFPIRSNGSELCNRRIMRSRVNLSRDWSFVGGSRLELW